MKIIHLSCVAPPQTGGTGRVAFEIVQRLVDRGEEATLIAPELKSKLETPDASFIKRLPAFPRWGNAAALTDLKPHLNEADVIHLHYPFYGTAEQVAEFCLWHKKPLVMTFHMDSKASFPLGMVFDLYRIFAQPAILRACKKIVTSSFDYTNQSSLASFKVSHPDRFIELPFGVDHAQFHPGEGDRAHFGIPADAQVIGFTGVMDHAHRFKGVTELLNAVSKMDSRIHLLLVGDGDQRRVYASQANDLGLTDRCHFAGRVSQDDLALAYRSMDVFAFPSTNGAEAFGLVAAEAFACGIPVVASNLPGVRTVVKDGVTGTLVPPKDISALRTALTSLLEHTDQRRTYGIAAAADARERYHWDRHVDRLMRTYEEVKS